MLLYIQFVNMKGMKCTCSASKEIKQQCIEIKANLYDLGIVAFCFFFTKIFFFNFSYSF